MVRFGYFSRFFGRFYIIVKNESFKQVIIITVKVKDDPLQILSVSQGLTCKIYLGEETGRVAVFSECINEGYWMHVQNKLIRTTYQWNVMDRHVFNRVQFYKTIPGS